MKVVFHSTDEGYSFNTKASTSNPILTLAHLFMTKSYSLENVFDDERKFPQYPFDEFWGKKTLKSELERGYWVSHLGLWAFVTSLPSSFMHFDCNLA